MIPLGHDLLHFDNIWGTTTSGTPMDTDGRWAKVFNAAFDAFRHVIGWIAESYPVHVLHVPGNHDRTTSWYLCRTLEEHFRASRHVTVDASPNRRKYTRWGVTLIASTHGEKEDHRSLPTIMAQEAPRYWADTSERVWLLGHTHQRKTQATTPVNTVDGVELRTMISPAGRDAWHHEMGYIGGRKQAETLLYGYESGFRGSVVATIDPALYAAEEAS
jgi:predicted phosphodiesterase